MKNKKALMFKYMIVAIISPIVLFVIVGPIIKGIFVDKQVKFAGAKTEELTTDCDGDGEIVGDACPCDGNIKDREELGEGVSCETNNNADRTCPTLCG